MSCNGCHVLRKGCNENCILRQSLASIDTPQAQASATLFVAKFYGRATLLSFLSSVSEHQRPVLFQSLLFEACGRTVNPVNGAVGLLGTGRWDVCESAVQTVLQGGTIHPNSQLFTASKEDLLVPISNLKEHRTMNESHTTTRSASSEQKLLSFFL